LRTALGESLGQLRHQFTHRDLALEVVALADRGGRLARGAADARFCGPAELEALALSALAKKALALRRPM
jgi:adenine-specific DNA glycosylase